MAEIRKGFTAPAEVTGYFDGKSMRPAFSWLDVWAQEHSYAFTVAKATETELLGAFHSSISAALKSGQSFENWKLDIRKDLARLGWLGPRMVADPTGEHPDRMVDFSSDRRLRNIFWSNMNSARSAGQWERAQRTKQALPYILYVRTTSGDPRPEHLAWVGIILPIDDAFWSTHWPPNGWGCKCQVRQISAREATGLLGREPKEGGVIYSSEPPDLGPDIPFRNRRTGEVTMIPPGIDPGWQTNPGLSRASTLVQNLEERLAAAPPADANTALKELWRDPYLHIAPRLPQDVMLPAGVSPKLAEELGAISTIVSIPASVVGRKVAQGRLADLALLPDVIGEGTVLAQPRGLPTTRALISKIGKAFWRVLVSVSESGKMQVDALDRRSASAGRRELSAGADGGE